MRNSFLSVLLSELLQTKSARSILRHPSRTLRAAIRSCSVAVESHAQTLPASPIVRIDAAALPFTFEHLTGLVGHWSLPREIGQDYLKQITAEHRVEERDLRGRVRYRWHQKHRDNHLLDCELMLMTAAVMTGLGNPLGAGQVLTLEASVFGALGAREEPQHSSAP